MSNVGNPGPEPETRPAPATRLVEVRRGFYLDSVALMRVSGQLSASAGVHEAALMMGTPANREILQAAQLWDDTLEAVTGGDLVIAIRATDQTSAEAARDRAQTLLAGASNPASSAASHRPGSIGAALRAEPRINFALISVPGPHAAGQAMAALQRGLDVMIFSDNVPIADEVLLKRVARDCDRLVMGPDCGTAIIGGVPLAFANQIPRGSIGIVGASGTGIQEVSSLIARHGGGVSHAIGVGGRDLSEAVGGLSTVAAIDALGADAGTERILVVSKPPGPGVVGSVFERLEYWAKPATVCFLGAEPGAAPANCTWVDTLEAAAHHALGLLHEGAPRAASGEAASSNDPSQARRIRGLFSGGTLCAEAQWVLLRRGLPVGSNAPIPGARGSADAQAHVLLDLGADEYTRGRPHPMIEPAVRAGPVAEALGDPTVSVLLVDIVLGLGGHPDPAGALLDTLGNAGWDRTLPVVAGVVGTDQDPQPRASQVAKLEAAGVLVGRSNAHAARMAAAALD